MKKAAWSLVVGFAVAGTTANTIANAAQQQYSSIQSESQTARSDSTDANFDADVLYGRSSNFWDTIDRLEEQPRTVSEVNDILDAQFNEAKEGIASFDVSFSSGTNEFFEDVFSAGYVGLGADMLVGGLATNRIFPEVYGYGIYTGHTSFGFLQKVAPGKTGFAFQVGSILGAGQQKLVDATAFDLYPEIPVEKSSVFFGGADLSLGYQNVYSEALSSQHEVMFLPVFFHANATDSKFRFKIEEEDIFWRWRTKSEWTAAPFLNRSPNLEFSALAISGQQPTPVQVLPRTWDAIHKIEPDPAFGQLLGIGTALTVRSEDYKYSARVDGGFYGGYWGAGFTGRVDRLKLGVGTWGYETTSGFQITESRIEYLQVGYQHAL